MKEPIREEAFHSKLDLSLTSEAGEILPREEMLPASYINSKCVNTNKRKGFEGKKAFSEVPLAFCIFVCLPIRPEDVLCLEQDIDGFKDGWSAGAKF